MCPLLFVAWFLKEILKPCAALQIYALRAVKAPVFSGRMTKCQLISHLTIFKSEIIF